MVIRSMWSVSGILLAVLSLVAGCATPEAAPPPGSLRLIFITCAVHQKFFTPLKKGMHDAAEMMGVECTFTGTPGVDTRVQAEMVRKAVADGYDGIALNIIDPAAFDEVIEEAVSQGIPVVAFNVDDHATPNARLSAVCQQLYQAGVTCGRHAAAWIPDNSHILMTQHDRGVSALDDRLRGEQDALREKGVRWTVVTTGNDAGKGAEVVAEALKKNPDIRVVLGTGQSDTEAAGLAIKRHFRGKGYWCAGFDLSENTLVLIKEGHIRFTIDQQPYVQGFYPVVQLTHCIRLGIMPSSVNAGAGIIDRSNVDRVTELTAKGYR